MTDFSGFRAAIATFMPSCVKSLAQLALIPGPPPTINATSLNCFTLSKLVFLCFSLLAVRKQV